MVTLTRAAEFSGENMVTLTRAAEFSGENIVTLTRAAEFSGENMKQYEITYLTKEEDSSTKAVSTEIEALDGKITSTSSLGQKQLAYRIKKVNDAYFTSQIFEIDGEKLGELNRKLTLKDEILRHLILGVKKMKETPRVSKVEAQKPIEEVPTEEKKPEVKDVEAEEPKEETKEKEVEVEKEIQKPRVPAKPKREKIQEELNEKERLEALDKKLDELLKE